MADAEQAFSEAIERAGLCRRTVLRQERAVQRIRNEINAGRRAAIAAELKKPARQVLTLIERLAECVQECAALAQRFGQDQHSLTAALFPLAPGKPHDHRARLRDRRGHSRA
jgi:hypothetical protein